MTSRANALMITMYGYRWGENKLIGKGNYMKIEFLADGAEDCPLIRMYDYRLEDIRLMQQMCRDLAAKTIEEIRLHDQSWIEPVNSCRFIWRTDKKNLGVRRPPDDYEFVLEYNEEGWHELDGLLEPFAKPFSGGFQWLTQQGDVNVLISANVDGTW